ncbi:MAG: signal peptidase II [Planctomycetes bacterium]|nr:signal peptidase II [Planctomycetota bacterium]
MAGVNSGATGEPTPAGPRSLWSATAWLLLLGVFTLAMGADLWTKEWAFRTVGPEPVVLDRAELLANPDYDPVGTRSARRVLPWGLLDFRLVLNPGAVFGIGAHQRWFFIVFTLGAIAAGLVIFGRYTGATDRLAHIALGLILAGGLGNLYDRIVFGRVRDFIHALPGRRLPYGWEWPGTHNPELFPWVFNVADMLLLAGMIALMVHVNRVERKRERVDAESASSSPP